MAPEEGWGGGGGGGSYREVIGSTSGAEKRLIRHIGHMYSREINFTAHIGPGRAGALINPPFIGGNRYYTGRCKAEVTQLHAPLNSLRGYFEKCL